MVSHPRAVVLSAVIAVLPGFAGGQDAGVSSSSRSGPILVDVQEQVAQAEEWATQTGEEPASPPAAPPEELPPPAPSQVPEPPSSEPPSTSSVPEGQWVYTQQYGWIWMPYADDFIYVPPAGYGAPYMYVYYPYYGWTWLVAPWVWGWGPWPYFGAYGPTHFAWYGYGWWRYPGYWPHGHASRHGHVPPHGVSPFPGARPGVRPYPGIRPSPGVRPAPAPFRGSAPSRAMGPAPQRGGGAAHWGAPTVRGGGPAGAVRGSGARPAPVRGAQR
ncbi:hypothetical protein Anae109_3654 [Anaeromyxobacter sp. Fw109-5]|nr:hypothetical protein Anae109_3654 [Anaeromyxobacter sp. Fw109-5]